MNLREIAWKIIKSSLEVVNPKLAVKNYLSYDEKERKIKVKDREFEIKGDIYLLSVGKASFPMTEGALEILGDLVKKGYVVVPYGYEGKLTGNIEILYSSHPIPDKNGERAAKTILNFVESLKEDDILVFLLSGGGSALLPLPKEEITLEDKIETTKLLLSCSARIQEINAVRKHLSKIKGGQLAEKCKGTIITLVVSDVLGNPLDSIASGPTVPDPTTYQDVFTILKKYDLWEKVPERVRELVKKGILGEIPETPKFINERHFTEVILSNRSCIERAIERAKELGFNTLFLTGFLEGEAREVAKVIAGIVKEIKFSQNPISPPCALIFGGETTVTLKGDGLGGRNQELALSFAIEIQGIDGVVLVSFATDGRDGPTDSAGAFADGNTVERAEELGMDPVSYLLNNDSYHFFEKINSLIKTGPTHTNVNDMVVVLVE
ncbi:glycerate kinase type-2 family protein [Dictyoglomus thermophilum]|uniref:Hydroxypyruvate reductase n=1 Tax=Dictyoglomus thermophilum (strain ATCC 35947 / DSM 3960 / H-6-12) TaxID=309799 RepID=B5YBF8_DICT6|nr:glycerate kinase [Dictyoglomus thermophilum]ACI18754.1 putative hydroxypyruvate reductase [Dictyoglomus thermophilum H-6-12]